MKLKIKLKKDIIIPQGTIFENIDGIDTHYAYDNYEYVLGLDKDTCVTIVVSSENEEYFEVEYEVVKNPRFKHICHDTQKECGR